jgi:hypothetical protein
MTAHDEPANAGAKHDLRRVGAHPDFWYPVAWSRRVKAGSSTAVTFAGDPIVLVRGESGTVFALENRCAHRQIPLSSGIVCGRSGAGERRALSRAARRERYGLQDAPVRTPSGLPLQLHA